MCLTISAVGAHLPVAGACAALCVQLALPTCTGTRLQVLGAARREAWHCLAGANSLFADLVTRFSHPAHNINFPSHPRGRHCVALRPDLGSPPCITHLRPSVTQHHRASHINAYITQLRASTTHQHGGTGSITSDKIGQGCVQLARLRLGACAHLAHDTLVIYLHSPCVAAIRGNEPHQDRGPACCVSQARGHWQAAHIRGD